MGINADDLIRAYGTQSYHAVLRLMQAHHQLGDRHLAIRFGCVAVQLARAYFDQEPDLGRGLHGGPALTVDQQVLRRVV